MSGRLYSDLGAAAAKDPIQVERERMGRKADTVDDGAEIYLRQEQRVREVTEAIRAKMAPPGSLKLPEMLEERRWHHSVPDGAFKLKPLYDWCFAYQLDRTDMEDGEKWGDSPLYKTQNAKAVGKNESPRALLISAGLGALDTLASHGICLGDVVFTVRNAPWAIQIATVGTERFYVRAFRDADLLAGEDLWKRLDSGELVQKTREDGEGKLIHYYETKEGKPLNPVAPWIPDDL